MVRRAFAVVIVGLIAGVSSLRAADPPDFKADAAFTGSSLANWRMVGQADWQAQNGEIVGKPKADAGGWLVMNKSFQDVQFFANVRCAAAPCCSAGTRPRATSRRTSPATRIIRSSWSGS